MVMDPVGKPGNDDSMARREDGVDTNDVVDWYVDFSPTPGFSNAAGGTPGGGDESGCGRKGEPGQGCSRGAPTAGASGGCAVLPMPFGGLEFFPLIVVAYRRRQS